MVKIEIQYFDGCPHAPAALELVKRFEQEHPETEAKYTKVADDAQAAEISFRGSPTLLINDKDLFGAPVPDEPHLACRFYPQGLPDYEAFIKLMNP